MHEGRAHMPGGHPACWQGWGPLLLVKAGVALDGTALGPPYVPPEGLMLLALILSRPRAPQVKARHGALPSAARAEV